MSKLVEIKNLHVEATTDAGRRIEIIKGVNIDIAKGEIVALIGESGSGKTTIALTLMGYTRPGCRIAGGALLVDGKDMAGLSERERAKVRGTEVAYVPQSAAAAFNPSQTIMDQVIEVTRIHGLMTPDKARERAIELFKALSLPSPETIGERYPHQVSGGQLQRLAAAMALIGGPKLVIFDEPTTALDVTTQIDVLKAFKSVMKAGGIAGVYVSHDLAVVAQIADRIVVLKGGEVQEEGTTEAILSTPTHPYTQELLSAFEPKETQFAGKRTDKARPLLEIENVIAGYGPIQADGLPFMKAVNSVSLSSKRAAISALSANPAAGSRRSPAASPGSCRRVPATSSLMARNSTTMHAGARARRFARCRSSSNMPIPHSTPPSPSRTFSAGLELLSRPQGEGARRPRR